MGNACIVVKKSVQQHLYVITRAQKRKLEEEKREKQRKARKESKEEEKIWEEV